MTAEAIRDLAILSIKSPNIAAQMLLRIDLPARFLWLALALMAVLNALTYALAMVLRPVDPSIAPVIFLPTPFVYLTIVGLGLYGLVWAIYIVGRWMGGTGSVQDVLILIDWLQFLRVLAQAATLVLMVVSSALSMLLSVAVSILGIWIGLHFINEAHKLGSLGKAAAVLIGAGLVTLMLVSVLLSIVAAPLAGAM